jgi:hypothetical protein
MGMGAVMRRIAITCLILGVGAGNGAGLIRRRIMAYKASGIAACLPRQTSCRYKLGIWYMEKQKMRSLGVACVKQRRTSLCAGGTVREEAMITGLRS